jgi:DNA-damage-inducible protein J
MINRERLLSTILARLGMNTTDAIRMFFAQIRLQQGLPFSVRIPNAETQTAIDELEAGLGDTTHE